MSMEHSAKVFSQALDQMEIGAWQGPIRSGLGIHLVRLEARVVSRFPELAEIHPLVMREWSRAKRLELREALNASMLEGYDIVIEWPESQAEDQLLSEAAVQ